MYLLHFGETLKFLRQSRGLKQECLTKDLISRTSISQIENQKQLPSYDMALFLIDNLDLSIAEFEYIKHDFRFQVCAQLTHDFTSIIETNNQKDAHELLKKVTSNQGYSHSNFKQQLIWSLNLWLKTPTCDLTKISLSLYNSLADKKIWTKIDLYLLFTCLAYLDDQKKLTLSQKMLLYLEINYPHLTYLELRLDQQIGLLTKKCCYLEKSLSLAQKLCRFDIFWEIYAEKAQLKNDASHFAEGLTMLKMLKKNAH